jgi:colanic acid/amylovoran biosynthesis glycosyltransferase
LNRFNLTNTFKRFPVELLHAHFGTLGCFLLDIKEKLNLPLITTFYGYDVSRLPRLKRWRQCYNLLFQKGDLFLAEGPHMKHCLIALGCPEEKIRIQPIAVDVNQFSYRARQPKANDRIILFFCGRFVEKKGLIDALRAMKTALNDFPNLEFRIIGDGDLRRSIERFIAQHKLSRYVVLRGYQPYHEVIKEMEKADIVIQPSLTDRDGNTEGGAPTILLEAQASGAPILSTYHADIPNVVVHGKSALLCREKDIDGLTHNLLYLLKHQRLWASMGAYGRSFVEKNHHIGIEAPKLEAVYYYLFQRYFGYPYDA